MFLSSHMACRGLSTVNVASAAAVLVTSVQIPNVVLFVHHILAELVSFLGDEACI